MSKGYRRKNRMSSFDVRRRPKRRRFVEEGTVRILEENLAKLPNNVPGEFYVSEDCDGCAYCGMVAPENFEFDKPTNTYFIARQPHSLEEAELVREAMEDCPVDAIHRADE